MNKITIIVCILCVSYFSKFAYADVSIKIDDSNYYGDLGTITANFIVSPIDKNNSMLEIRKFDSSVPYKVKFVLNGKDIPFTSFSSTFYSDAINGITHGFKFYPGIPGIKTLEITVGDYNGKTQFNYYPKGNVDILDIAENEALFDQDELILNWAGYYIETSTLDISINGVHKNIGIDKNVPYEGLSTGVIYDIPVGKNEITINCVDMSGNTLEKKKTFYNFAQFMVPIGSDFIYTIAKMGSKSGPFYKTSFINNNLIEEKSDGFIDIPTLFNGVLFSRPRNFYIHVKAVKSGNTGIIIKKEEGAYEWKKIRDIFFTVYKGTLPNVDDDMQ